MATEAEERERFEHTCYPIYNEQSKILILGTFPSVKSREEKFYYGHPQNRFWKVIAAITEENVPTTIEEKKALLLRNHIALWDVIHSCEIIGSSDSSIRNVIPNDISLILNQCNIKSIYGNGGTSARLFKRYLSKQTEIPMITLPSTSPANASYSLDRLVECWSIMKGDLA